jgi:hypothetical protein
MLSTVPSPTALGTPGREQEWHPPVIPTLGRLRQEIFKFQASLELQSEILPQRNKKKKKKKLLSP